MKWNKFYASKDVIRTTNFRHKNISHIIITYCFKYTTKRIKTLSNKMVIGHLRFKHTRQAISYAIGMRFLWVFYSNLIKKNEQYTLFVCRSVRVQFFWSLRMPMCVNFTGRFLVQQRYIFCEIYLLAYQKRVYSCVSKRQLAAITRALLYHKCFISNTKHGCGCILAPDLYV